MSRIWNFSAGPAALPEEVLQQAQAEMLDWHGAGCSVMEMSHRGKEFMSILDQAEADLRELMGIPEQYKVLFLQGGATQQFAQIPMNLLAGRSADYIVTGSWSKKAFKEAHRIGNVRCAATTESSGFTRLPMAEEIKLDPFGLTLVVVHRDLLGMAPLTIPTVMDYAVMAENGSMLNTPPTYAIYIAGLVFQWLKRQGGLAGIAAVNAEKARLLYAAIDDSEGFYSNPVDPDCRSAMNVPFVLANPELDAAFLAESKAAGLASLKGHKSVGGMRASIYNAVSLEAVQALVAFMNDFAKRNG